MSSISCLELCCFVFSFSEALPPTSLATVSVRALQSRVNAGFVVAWCRWSHQPLLNGSMTSCFASRIARSRTQTAYPGGRYGSAVDVNSANIMFSYGCARLVRSAVHLNLLCVVAVCSGYGARSSISLLLTCVFNERHATGYGATAGTAGGLGDVSRLAKAVISRADAPVSDCAQVYVARDRCGESHLCSC